MRYTVKYRKAARLRHAAGQNNMSREKTDPGDSHPHDNNNNSSRAATPATDNHKHNHICNHNCYGYYHDNNHYHNQSGHSHCKGGQPRAKPKNS